jgi:probable phosphoglycerate mutase
MPDMPTRIVLVRHGQTALNAEGRLRGLADPPLDDTGIAQARATAQALHAFDPSHVLSSPLQRAVRTAAIIAETTGATHTIDPAFNDRDYGPWTGQVKTDVIRRWGSIDNAPDVEPEQSVLVRATQALNNLTRDGGGNRITVVTHDAVIRPILTSIRPGMTLNVETGSWAELIYDDGWTIVSVDNTAPPRPE